MDERLDTTYDREGRLIDASPAFIEAFGPAVEASLGRRPPYPWWPESTRDSMVALFDRAISVPASALVGVEFVVQLRDRTGSIRRHAVSCERLPNGDTRVVGRPIVPVENVSRAIDLLREGLSVGVDEDERADEGPRATEASPADRMRTALLSPRERDVCRLLVDGSSTAEIAETLYLSIHTVRNHRKAIYRKLGVSSQVELMRLDASS